MRYEDLVVGKLYYSETQLIAFQNNDMTFILCENELFVYLGYDSILVGDKRGNLVRMAILAPRWIHPFKVPHF